MTKIKFEGYFTKEEKPQKPSEERVKRTYNLPISTITKLYELKSKYPTKDIEVIVNEAIQDKHSKEFAKDK